MHKNSNLHVHMFFIISCELKVNKRNGSVLDRDSLDSSLSLEDMIKNIKKYQVKNRGNSLVYLKKII